MAAPLLGRRKSIMAAKAETVIGTAETLANADGAWNIFDLDIQPNRDYTRRPQQGSLSKMKGTTGPAGANVTFSTEVPDVAGVPLFADVLLPACGWKKTGAVFTPAPITLGGAGSTQHTITIRGYHDGKIKQVRGAMGSFVINYTSGQRIMFDFTFLGLYDPVTDGAALTPTYPTTRPVQFKGATFTIGGQAAPAIREFTINSGENVILREDGQDTTGYVSALVTNREDIGGTMNPESDLAAGLESYNLFDAETESALVLDVTGPGGGGLALAAPALQISEAPRDEDRDGLMIDSVSFDLNAGSAGGFDELSLTFAT